MLTMYSNNLPCVTKTGLCTGFTATGGNGFLDLPVTSSHPTSAENKRT